MIFFTFTNKIIFQKKQLSTSLIKTLFSKLHNFVEVKYLFEILFEKNQMFKKMLKRS
jgi:hypothetical protein